MSESGAVTEAGAELETAPHLCLTGYEGPLDLLLDLARAQKVDLAQISILQLVEQFLSFVQAASKEEVDAAGTMRIRLELAADWLVMAAWLTWLKSRLLLPADHEPDSEAEQASDLLQGRLQELGVIRNLALWLEKRPRLGVDVFARGVAEDMTLVDRSGLSVDVMGLIAAYLSVMRRAGRKRHYAPPPLSYWTVTEAVAALKRLLNVSELDRWHDLSVLLLPQTFSEPKARAAALASALVAGLEMAKCGELELRQDGIFDAIMIRASQGRNKS